MTHTAVTRVYAIATSKQSVSKRVRQRGIPKLGRHIATLLASTGLGLLLSRTPAWAQVAITDQLVIDGGSTETIGGASPTQPNPLALTRNLVVGNSGAGTLDIIGGLLEYRSDATPFQVWIGNELTSVGTVSIQGGSTMETNSLTIGEAGTGSVNIFNYGQLYADDSLIIGNQASAIGTLSMSAPGARLDVGSLQIGVDGQGTLLMDDYSYLRMNLGAAFGVATGTGTGTLRVDNNSLLTLTNAGGQIVRIGGAGDATVEVLGGSRIEARLNDVTVIGEEVTSTSSLTVSGTNSVYEASRLTIGENGQGSLEISDGGKVDLYYNIGRASLANVGSGDITVTGNGSLLKLANLSWSGNDRNIDVLDGGKIDASDSVYVDTNNSDRITVSDADSEFSITNRLSLGVYDQGSMLVRNNASLAVTGEVLIGTEVGGNGTLDLTSGSESSMGSLVVGDEGTGSLTIDQGATLDVNGLATIGSVAGSTGTVSVSGNGSELKADSVQVGVDGNGRLFLDNQAYLEITGTGGIDVAAGTGTGTFSMDNDSNLTLITGAMMRFGVAGNATAEILASSVLDVNDELIIADQATSTSSLTVSGSGSQLYADSMQVGVDGDGSLTLDNQAYLEITGTGGFDVAAGTGTGTFTMNNQSTMNLSVGALVRYGVAGDATVNIRGGSIVGANFGLGTVIAAESTSNSSLTVSGEDSYYEASDMSVGEGGTGRLVVSDGGEVKILYNVGRFDTNNQGSGSVLITGSGSKLDVANMYWREDDTELEVLDGGELNSRDGFYINKNNSDLVTISDAGSELNVADWLILGGANQANLQVEDDASMQIGGEATIARDAGGTGSLVLTSGSTSEMGSLVLGRAGTGSLALDQGATLDVNGLAAIGTLAGSTGTMSVSGNGSRLYADSVQVGVDGDGTLLLDDEGYMEISGGSDSDIAAGSGTGTVTLDNDSHLAIYGGGTTIRIGGAGNATFEVLGGSSVDAAAPDVIIIGDQSTSVSSLTVSGANSSFGTRQISLGESGQGSLIVSDGGEVAVDYNIERVDGNNLGSGTITVTGADSELRFSNLGWQGNDGEISVLNGATMRSTGGVFINTDDGDRILVSGANSILDVGTTLTLGHDQEANLIAAAGGTVSAGTEIAIATSTGSVGSLAIGAASGNAAAAAGVIDTDLISFGDGDGQLVFNHTGTNYILASDITGDGNIYAYAGTTSLTGDLSGFSGGLNIDGGAVNLNSSFTANIDLDSGQLIFDHNDTNYILSSDITGSGAIDVYSGNSTLTGDMSGYTGQTTVSGGRLSINSDFGGTVTVENGGTLGGNGTLAAVELESGATLGPGNSIGTLNVGGDLDFVAGSTYAVEVDSLGNADKVVASGTITIDNGATLSIAPVNGTDTGQTYQAFTNYTILQAAALTGAFGTVEDDFAFLDASVAYNSTSATLTLTRNTTSFDTLASTPNQKAVAKVIEGQGAGDVYSAILGLPDGEPAAAFDALSGEMYADLSSGLMHQSLALGDIMSRRLQTGFDAEASKAAASNISGYASFDKLLSPAKGQTSVWMTGTASRIDLNATEGTYETSARSSGFAIGADQLTEGGWRIGLMGGVNNGNMRKDALASQADSETYQLATYAGRKIGPLGLKLGLSHGWSDIDTKRTVAFTGFSDELRGSLSAYTTQGFVEAGWQKAYDLWQVEPFNRVAFAHSIQSSFSETGGASALNVERSTENRWVNTLGIRVSRDIALNGMLGKLRASAGWRRILNDTTSSATMAFAGTENFSVTGAQVARDAALLGLGADLEFAENAQLSIDYAATITSKGSAHDINGKFNVQF